MKFIIVYITNKNLKEAKNICSNLLNKRLIACANFFPIQSLYWWNGKIETGKEVVSIVKARKENWKKIKNKVIKNHSYDVPCVIKIEVEGSSEYAKWIKTESRPLKS